MKYSKINEELEIETNIQRINKNFRKYIEQVFSKTFLKKIDRVFKEPLVVENFKEDSNVMAATSGTQIMVNSKMFNSLKTSEGLMYIIHEFFHVLQNMEQFKEIKTVNRLLGNITKKYISSNKINLFLTGKEQNIHSDANEEFLSYCSNFAFKFDLAPNLKKEYYRILDQSGLFNIGSEFWSKRFK